MSSIKLESNSSGTGVFTIASPNSNTNRTLTLPDSTGTVVVTGGAQTIEFAAGSASTPSITTTGDTNTGIFFPAADTIAFTEGGTESMRIDSSGNVGIGNSTARARLTVSDGTVNTAGEAVYQGYIVGADRSGLTEGNLAIQSNDAIAINKGGSLSFGGRAVTSSTAGANWARIAGLKETATSAEYGGYLQFATRPNSGAMLERARITSDGHLLVGATSVPGSSNALTGIALYGTGAIEVARDGSLLIINRKTTDGTLVFFRQDGTDEGSISVSGTTVSYNGGHLSRWAQMPGTKDDTLLKGTVMSNLDEMNVYTDAEGNPVDNEQLNKVKVSDVEGDVNVAGVFVNWTQDEAHQVDEINMAMTGDMIIRIAQGVVVQKGDLLMSAGDGTAKPQGDDIVRSKTVAKVTSNHVTCTYADGSYCVPCVLMAC